MYNVWCFQRWVGGLSRNDVLRGNVKIVVSPKRKMALLARMSQISGIGLMVCYNRKIETRIFHAFPQAGSIYWVNNKDPRTTSMTSVFQPSVFFCKNNTRAPDDECIKIWFSSGHGRECCSQRTFFQSRTNLLCWLPNICSWRYLWRIRQESYGTSSEKNSWWSFW